MTRRFTSADAITMGRNAPMTEAQRAEFNRKLGVEMSGPRAPVMVLPAGMKFEPAPESVTLRILGHARPGGSKTFIPHRHRDGSLVIVQRGNRPFPMGSMIDDAKGNAEWKKSVKTQARVQYRAAPMEGPLEVYAVFTIERPKYHRNSKGLKADAPKYHTTRPDGAKLRRSTCDALTEIIWSDDGQIAIEHVTKIYGDVAGVEIKIFQLAPTAADLFTPDVADAAIAEGRDPAQAVEKLWETKP